jgi:hypothetical protein
VIGRLQQVEGAECEFEVKEVVGAIMSDFNFELYVLSGMHATTMYVKVHISSYSRFLMLISSHFTCVCVCIYASRNGHRTAVPQTTQY